MNTILVLFAFGKNEAGLALTAVFIFLMLGYLVASVARQRWM